jgi:levanase/fructan beta-fructosidase
MDKILQQPGHKNPGTKDFRASIVSWRSQSKNWPLTLAAENEIQFYMSKNLKDWAVSGKFGSDEGSDGGV